MKSVRQADSIPEWWHRAVWPKKSSTHT